MLCDGHHVSTVRTSTVAYPTSSSTSPTSSITSSSSSTFTSSCDSLPRWLLLWCGLMLPMRSRKHINGWSYMRCLPTRNICSRTWLSIMLLLPSRLQLSACGWNVLLAKHLPRSKRIKERRQKKLKRRDWDRDGRGVGINVFLLIILTSIDKMSIL